MATVFARNWWSLAIRGLLGVIFGIVAFMAPGAAITGVALAFGAFVLVTGMLAITFAIQAARGNERWGAILLEGVVGVIAGILTLMAPALAALAFVTLIAAWSIFSGGAQIAAAIRLRKVIQHEWLLAFAGVVSITFGVIVFGAPLAGAVVLAWWIGAYAFVLGILQIALAFKLRSWSKREPVTWAGARAA